MGRPCGSPGWQPGARPWLWPQLARAQKRQALMLAGAGAVAFGVALGRGGSPSLLGLLTQNTALLGMLAAVSFLRLLRTPEAGSAGLPKGRGQGGPVLAAHGVLMLCVLALAAVCVFNLHPQDAVWGIYFFGSFTLGVLAAWGRRGETRWAFTALILGIATAGLMLAWRDRLALACMVALLLLWQPARGWLARSRVQPAVAALAAWSYAVFMVHYPVSLMVNGAFERWLPHDPGNALLGLLLTWVLSIALGAQAHRLLERRPARAAAQPLPAGTALAPPHGR